MAIDAEFSTFHIHGETLRLLRYNSRLALHDVAAALAIRTGRAVDMTVISEHETNYKALSSSEVRGYAALYKIDASVLGLTFETVEELRSFLDERYPWPRD